MRASILRARRRLRDGLEGSIRRHPVVTTRSTDPVIAHAAAELWTGSAAEDGLTAGKIHNLRCAATRLHGVEVPAGALFSFWAHVGRPSRRRGYAEGRELREGCMVASIGGGLCQMTNLLYQAALDAGLEIVERHAHSRIVPGSSAEAGRDATVFWNYLDLRFRSPHAFRIEIEMTAETITVRLRGHAPAGSRDTEGAPVRTNATECGACTDLACRQHPSRRARAADATAWLVDAGTPEFAAYFETTAADDDLLVAPSRRIGRSSWPLRPNGRGSDLAAVMRSLVLRTGHGPLAERSIRAARTTADAHARHLSHRHTHLVVSQSLLPHLWRAGVLRGRSYDVLLERATMRTMHHELDALLQLHPYSQTAGDYRAPEDLLAAEEDAIAGARHVLTPNLHAAATILRPSQLLEWRRPAALSARRGGDIVYMPGSALARRGAYEVRHAVRELGIEIVVGGSAQERADFWEGVPATVGGRTPERIGAVVLPAHVSTSPRTLLAAIEAGIPVLTTRACGLPMVEGVEIVPAGDAEALTQALARLLGHAASSD